MEKFALITFLAAAGTVVIYAVIEVVKQKRKGNV